MIVQFLIVVKHVCELTNEQYCPIIPISFSTENSSIPSVQFSHLLVLVKKAMLIKVHMSPYHDRIVLFCTIYGYILSCFAIFMPWCILFFTEFTLFSAYSHHFIHASCICPVVFCRIMIAALIFSCNHAFLHPHMVYLSPVCYCILYPFNLADAMFAAFMLSLLQSFFSAFMLNLLYHAFL